MFNFQINRTKIAVSIIYDNIVKISVDLQNFHMTQKSTGTIGGDVTDDFFFTFVRTWLMI